jgi:hypothetical protein
MKLFFNVILASGLLALTACSSDSGNSATETQHKAPQAVSGSSAFFKCYIAARTWAPDAQPFRAESQPMPGFTGHDGKAESWRVGFASPAKRSTRPFTWINGDISHEVEDTYSPTNTSTQVFNVQFLKSDSDKAFAVAQEHGGDKLLEKEPDTPVFYILEWNHLENTLLWHVIYGTDRDSAKLRVAVNASTGEFSRVEK